MRRLAALLSYARFFQFLAVGATGALVDTATLVAVVEFANLDPVIGKVVSAEAAIVVMFVVNESWTFDEFGTDRFVSRLRRLARSNGVRLGGLLVGMGVLAALHRWWGVWYVAANAAGIGVGFVVNYVFESLFTWQVHRR